MCKNEGISGGSWSKISTDENEAEHLKKKNKGSTLLLLRGQGVGDMIVPVVSLYVWIKTLALTGKHSPEHSCAVVFVCFTGVEELQVASSVARLLSISDFCFNLQLRENNSWALLPPHTLCTIIWSIMELSCLLFKKKKKNLYCILQHQERVSYSKFDV